MDALSPTAELPDNVVAAREAGLIYSDDGRPGISRRGAGKGFAYFDAKGVRIRDKAVLARIKSIVIPPAWSDVWISPSARGHIQATGRDARGRKQYRYHDDWRAHRDLDKYDLMLEFAAALPKLRAAMAEHLCERKLSRRRVLAVVVLLLQQTLIRIGNATYARENESYGLTTLTTDHVEIAGGTLRFQFRGKSGKEWKLAISDRRIANVVRQCQDLPGQTLFGYLDETGEACAITSNDVNDYLREMSGFDFTAKTFRTWAGTVIAARALASQTPGDSKTARKRAASVAIKIVAARLGNTPAVCRSSYVHPTVLESFEDGVLQQAFRIDPPAAGPDDWIADESAVLSLLRKRLKTASRD